MKIRFRPLIIAAAVLATGGCSLFRSTISPELRSLGFRATLREEQCILTAANGSTLTITPGSTRTLFNGTIVHLPEPAFRDAEGRISLTPLSLQKTVEPLLNRRTGNARPVKRILLDPGHGGAELGAVGKSCQEKALNLALSLAVKRELEKRGYTVLMTRAKDQAVSLDRRGKLTGELRADLFLSIHHNASPSNPKATGIETYALTPGGAASTSGGSPGKALPANRFDTASINLAERIQTRLVRATGGPDRGTKYARFRVLTLAECPAVLIEAGFISTPLEEQAIASPLRQQRAAAAIAEGVAAYDAWVRRNAALP